MQSNFLPKLINDPLGDPGVMVEFLCEKRGLLFDLGDLSSITNGELLKISHVFISHTHIDHFIGFDHFLRVVFGRGKTIHLYGPENFIANVVGKLAGFTWNLVDRYSESVSLEVVEVHETHLIKVKLKAIDQFKKSDEIEIPFEDGVLVDEDRFVVRSAILEHRIPCLGFSLEEKNHVNICKERLEKMCYRSGPWLNELKKYVYEGKPDEYLLEVPSMAKGSQKKTLGHLKEELVLISPGQKISYVVDTVYNDANNIQPIIINFFENKIKNPYTGGKGISVNSGVPDNDNEIGEVHISPHSSPERLRFMICFKSPCTNANNRIDETIYLPS